MIDDPGPVSATSGAATQPKFLADLPEGASVLIVRLRSLGDTVLLTPSLRLLHDWRPDLSLSVLLDPPWDTLLGGNPCVQSILASRGKLATLRQIRSRKFSCVINLHGGPTSALFTRWSGAVRRAGFAHFRNSSAYSILVPTAQEVLGRSGPVHTAEHVASCFFWLGVPVSEIPRAEIFPHQAARTRVGQVLHGYGIQPGEPYAVIHPTATYETKRWNASGFAKIGAYLENNHGVRPVFLCARDEEEIISAIERSSSSQILRAVGWPLEDVMALISGARIFLGNDSGPAHLAAAAQVPVAVIFGSSNSDVWRPWQAVDSEVVQNDFACNPCAGDRCHAFEEPRCILSVTAEQVRAAVDLLLSTYSISIT